MIHQCRNCESNLGKVRSSRTEIEYCLQCGAALNGVLFEPLEGKKTADENDYGYDDDDFFIDT